MKRFTLSQVRRVLVTGTVVARDVTEAFARFKALEPPLVEGDDPSVVYHKQGFDRPPQVISIEDEDP